MKKFFKGLKKLAGVAAMIAAPFIAAPIAGAIGASGIIGTALTGAAIGGLGAAAAGYDPVTGALLGGLGAGVGAYNAAGAAGAAGAQGTQGGLFDLFSGPAPGSTGSMVASAPAAGLSTGASGAAAGGGGFFGGLNAGNLALPAALMFTSAPQDLTAEEQALLQRNQETAARENALFNTKLDASRSLIQQGTANPERAFAEGQMAAQRGLRDTERTAALSGRGGLQDANRRRAAIEGARIGTAAVTGEQARAASATQAGLSALPSSTPTSAEELNMSVYRDLYDRRGDFARDLAGTFGQLSGNMNRGTA